jgi:hypothetical protein
MDRPDRKKVSYQEIVTHQKEKYCLVLNSFDKLARPSLSSTVDSTLLEWLYSIKIKFTRSESWQGGAWEGRERIHQLLTTSFLSKSYLIHLSKLPLTLSSQFILCKC